MAIRVTGEASFSQAVKVIEQKLKIKVYGGVEEACVEAEMCGLDLKEESANRAPIESADLRRSAYIETTHNSDVFRVEVGFDKENQLPYKWVQHEDLSLNHDRTDGYMIRTGKNAGRTVNMVAGGEAKFLQRPALENMQRYAGRIKQAARRGMRRG